MAYIILDRVLGLLELVIITNPDTLTYRDPAFTMISLLLFS